MSTLACRVAVAVAVVIAGCTQPEYPATRRALEPLSAQGDTALVGTDLDSLPGVRLLDVNGYAVGAGVPVTFGVASGGGTITGSQTVTDALGAAFVGGWHLGPTVGVQTLTVTADGLATTLGAVATPRASPGVFTSMTAGFRQTCALAPAGVAYCWGFNGDGQLGDGSQADRSVPTPVRTSSRFQKIVTNYDHTCALDVDQRAYCWGANTGGAIGDSTTMGQLLPTAVHTNLRFSDIAVGNGQTCAVALDAAVYCWGVINGGKSFDVGEALSDSAVQSSLLPRLVPGGRSYRLIGAWKWLTCALDTSGTPVCWGRRSETGFSAYGRPVPTAITGAPPLVSLTVGDNGGCGLTADGSLYCWSWGENIAHRSSESRFSQVSDGLRPCGVAVLDHFIRCWDTPFDPSGVEQPAVVSRGLEVSAVVVGGHQCALTSDGAPYCWGANDSGQLGTGRLARERIPTAIALP